MLFEKNHVTSCKDRDSNDIHFLQKPFNMKIAKKKVRMRTPLVNLIINLESLLEKVVKKGKYKAIKYHNTITLDPMKLTSPSMEEDHLRSGLSGKTNFSSSYMAKASVQDR